MAVTPWSRTQTERAWSWRLFGRRIWLLYSVILHERKADHVVGCTMGLYAKGGWVNLIVDAVNRQVAWSVD